MVHDKFILQSEANYLRIASHHVWAFSLGAFPGPAIINYVLDKQEFIEFAAQLSDQEKEVMYMILLTRFDCAPIFNKLRNIPKFWLVMKYSNTHKQYFGRSTDVQG